MTLYGFGPFRLDAGERMLYRDGQPVSLPPRAVDTLRVLVERQGRLVTKDELFAEVWREVVVEENNLAQQVSILRRTLAAGIEGPTIETVPKRGYRFVVPVTVDAPADPAPPAEPDRAALADQAPATPPARTFGKSWVVAASAALLVALAWGGWSTRALWATRVADPGTSATADAVPRIAVLPFVNLGGAEGNYLAAGTTEELTSRLARNSRLKVVSSTSAREYDRHGKTLREIGEHLGASYVVEGSVRQAEGDASRLRLISKLIRVADDVTVWTEEYDTSLARMEDTHADIARQIDAAFGRSRPGRAAPVPVHMTSDTDAYLAYLRGISAFQQAPWDTALIADARRNLEIAVARDPRFAQAWSWLASTYVTMYSIGVERTPEMLARAYEAGRKAVALAPDLPDAHIGLAYVMATDRQYDAALREMEVAGPARASFPDALRIEGTLHERKGEWRRTVEIFQRAFEIDPAASSDVLAVTYLHLRDFENARRYVDVAKAANRTAAIVPQAWMLFSENGDVAGARAVLEAALRAPRPADARVRGLLARLEWIDGRYERALQLVDAMDPAGAWMPANFRFPAAIARGQILDSMGQGERAKRSYADALAGLQRRPADDYQVAAGLALAYAGLGRTDDAVREAQRATQLLPVSKDAIEAPVYAYTAALVYARLGRHEDAFAVLDHMFERPSFYTECWVDRDPWFSTLRTDPAYASHRRQWAERKGERLLQSLP